MFAVQTALGCAVFHLFVSHCKLSEFWPITCKMLSVEVVRRAAHEYILFFLQTQAKFCFLFPFCAFK